MVPPGLAFVYMSDRAWAAHETATAPRFFFDATRAKDSLARGQTPWTPAISLFYGMDRALGLMREEGLEAIFGRHEDVAGYTRERVKKLGLRLVAEDEARASNTVTAVYWPDRVDGTAIAKRAREEFGVVLGGGQGKLQGKIFRVGHLGWFTRDEIVKALDVVEELLGNA